MARVYAEVNENMPRSYWDYDSVNISTSSAAKLDWLNHWCYRKRCDIVAWF